MDQYLREMGSREVIVMTGRFVSHEQAKKANDTRHFLLQVKVFPNLTLSECSCKNRGAQSFQRWWTVEKDASHC